MRRPGHPIPCSIKQYHKRHTTQNVDTFTFSYPKYLSAKECVDEQSLNRRVLRRFIDELCGRTESGLRILEIGGGTGAMLRRLIPLLDVGSTQVLDYTLVDEREENVEAAESALRSWTQDTEYRVRREGEREYVLQKEGGARVSVDFQVDDLFDYARKRGEVFDAIIAQAVLDLVDLHQALRTLGTRLRTGGLWYLPIHFDGITAFEPSLDPEVDRMIEQFYHESMSEPRTGRRILTGLRETNSALLEVGSSDWIVHSENGEYSSEERYFLWCILYFIYNELSDQKALASATLDRWIQRRKQQIEAGELTYIAHQIDVCAEYKKT